MLSNSPWRCSLALALFLSVLTWSLSSTVSAEDVINPSQQGGSHGESAGGSNGDDHLPSYEMPAVVVPGRAKTALREEDPIGENLQPRWTARRRFGETRVYVRPAGDFEFEYWMIPEAPRHNGKHSVTNQYEVEMGLPYRFQIDLYLVSEQDGNSGAWAITQQKFEGRWAFANWGVIPGNPTLYLEWIAINNEPDHLEGKLLLGDEITSHWHWGLNLVAENQMGWRHEDSYELTMGLSYTVLDEKLSVGAEAKFAFVDDTDTRGHYTNETLIGPSIQFRPLPKMHINITGLLGTSKYSPESKALIVFGWEFS